MRSLMSVTALVLLSRIVLAERDTAPSLLYSQISL